MAHGSLRQMITLTLPLDGGVPVTKSASEWVMDAAELRRRIFEPGYRPWEIREWKRIKDALLEAGVQVPPLRTDFWTKRDQGHL